MTEDWDNPRPRMQSWPAPKPMPPIAYERIRAMPARKQFPWLSVTLLLLGAAYLIGRLVLLPLLISGRFG